MDRSLPALRASFADRRAGFTLIEVVAVMAIIAMVASLAVTMTSGTGRGRLKVYLGYGPGVGKTYQMLLEGHRLKTDGIDVVVGVVETHNRPETMKLVEGLEVVPRRKVESRSTYLRKSGPALLANQLLARRGDLVPDQISSRADGDSCGLFFR